MFVLFCIDRIGVRVTLFFVIFIIHIRMWIYLIYQYQNLSKNLLYHLIECQFIGFFDVVKLSWEKF